MRTGNEEQHTGGQGVGGDGEAFRVFMQAFWDLASSDTTKRLNAVAAILRHVEANGSLNASATAKSSSAKRVGAQGDAIDYTVKRLVRGLCSSREAARQGFATCLVELLATVPESAVGTAAIFTTLMEVTKPSGTMRRHEERDLAFGRLFGCVALGRSGRLAAAAAGPGPAEDLCVRAVGALLPLYVRRRWMRQAAVEALLLVAGQMRRGALVARAVPMLLPLLAPDTGGKGTGAAAAAGAGDYGDEEEKGNRADEDVATADGGHNGVVNGGPVEVAKVSELTPDQLMLALGLQRLLSASVDDDALPEDFPKLLRKRILRPGKLEVIFDPLVASAAAFPRVHGVWTETWRQLGMAAGAAAQTGAAAATVPAPVRAAALGEAEVRVLRELWEGAVDERLANGSHNTKGLAILLLQQVLPLVPPDCVDVVISPSVMRVLMNHTARPDATLRSMASACLERLPDLTADNAAARAAAVAALMARGSAVGGGGGGAGAFVGAKLMTSLAGGMDESAMLRHVDELIAAATSSGKSGAAGHKADTQSRVAAIDALYGITKTSGSALGGGVRGGEGGLGTEWHGRISKFFLECGFFEPDGALGGTTVLPEVREACRSRFFSLIADLGNRPLVWQAVPEAAMASGGRGRSRRSKQGSVAPAVMAAAGAAVPAGKAGPGVLEELWWLHAHWTAMATSGRQLLKTYRLDEDEKAARTKAMSTVGTIRSRVAAAPAEADDEEGGGSGGGGALASRAKGKVEAALAGLLMHVGLQLLALEPETRSHAADHLGSLQEVCRSLVPDIAASAADEDGEDDEEAGAGDDPMALLADVLIGVLSAPAGGLIRGLRDAVKRAWGSVVAVVPAGPAAVAMLGAAVCGEEENAAEEEEGGTDNEEEDSSEEDDDDDDGGNTDEGGNGGKGKAAANSGGGGGNGSGSDDGSNDDSDSEGGDAGKRKGGAAAKTKAKEGEEEEEMVSADELEALLAGDDSGDEEDGMVADKALAAMLALRRQGRKAGRAQAEREKAQMSLRALDLLEVLCAKQSANPHLPSLLTPVYATLRRLAPGPSTPEGCALQERLTGLFTARLCKARPKSFNAEGWSPAEGVTFFMAEATRLDKCSTGRGKANAGTLTPSASQGIYACVRMALGRAEAAEWAVSKVADADTKASKGKAEGSRRKKRPAPNDTANGEEDSSSVASGEAAQAHAEANTVIAAITEAVAGYLLQRRSSAALGQLVTGLVNRFPPVWSSLVPALMAAASGAETDFLKAEAFRLLSEVLSHRKLLKPAGREKLGRQMPLVIHAMADMLVAASQPKAEDGEKGGNGATGPKLTKGARAKRIKPVLQCCSAALAMEKEGRRAAEAAEGAAGALGGAEGWLADDDLERLAAAARETAQLTESAAVTAMCETIASTAEGLIRDDGGGNGGDGGGAGEAANERPSGEPHKKPKREPAAEAAVGSPAVAEGKGRDKGKKKPKHNARADAGAAAAVAVDDAAPVAAKTSRKKGEASEEKEEPETGVAPKSAKKRELAAVAAEAAAGTSAPATPATGGKEKRRKKEAR